MKGELLLFLAAILAILITLVKGTHWFIRTLRWSLRARFRREIVSLNRANQRFHADVERATKRVEQGLPGIASLVSDLAGSSRRGTELEAAQMLLDARRELIDSSFVATSALSRKAHFERRMVDIQEVLSRRTDR